MAEFPALPLWTDAYLGDTTHLNATQHGAYLLLLMTAWRSTGCSLPDDDKLLARYARCSAAQWRSLRPVLAEFFTIENGRWAQGRLTDEFQAALDRREKAAANGRASALKRKGRHSAKRKQRDNGASAEREPSEDLTIDHNHYSEDKSSGANGADPVKALFDLGVAILTEAGRPEKEARSLIGKWKKDHGVGPVAAALVECQAMSPPIAEPVEWLTKRFSGTEYVSASGYRYHGTDEQVMRKAHERADWTTYYRAKENVEGRKAVGT